MRAEHSWSVDVCLHSRDKVRQGSEAVASMLAAVAQFHFETTFRPNCFRDVTQKFALLNV